ncbi:MAG: CmcI family methyltransferase [Acidimicrobiales bacterium]
MMPPTGPIAAHRDRYLALLGDALLDLHYLDNEARIGYLTSLPPGATPDADVLRDPIRKLEIPYRRLFQSRIAGRSGDQARGGTYNPYTDMGRAALDHLRASLVDVVERGVPGDVAECGVGRGGGGIFLRACLDAYDVPDRTVWMIDPFLASDPDAPDDHQAMVRLRADLNLVREGFERFGVFDERVRFLQGAYRSTLADAPLGQLALLRVGLSAAYDAGTVLGRLLPKVAEGGIVIVEGVDRPTVEGRLRTFLDGLPEPVALEHVDWNTVAWRVGAPVASAPTTEPGPDPVHHRVPLPTPAPGPPDADRVDLSVVVVFYDMAREAKRTLQSLARSYQRGIDDLTYEVIAIDNGSHAEQRLDPAAVAAYGPEFRLVTLEEASPSPTVALNLGIAQARGDVVAVMIDGAHVLTPGVFRHALAATRTYAPAVVAVQQWYVGPGQQGDAQQAGYDQAVEDRLFEGIRWPTDGYRLFEIGHFIGDRDWFDGIIESNCLFVPRTVLEQVGGFDDSFDMPGGGYANLELFERMHAHPGVNPATILGEGTFHQFHGGTTTNVADEAVRRDRISSYGAHFRETRGRGLNGVTKPIHYVGSLDTKAARRTRSRREFALSFAPGRDPVADTDAPGMPVPEELKFAAIEAVWAHQSWREASWLGVPVARYPTDLHSYQELIHQVRPGAIVLLGDDVGLGGRALFAASVADQLGLDVRIVAAGRAGAGPRPEHPSITYLDGAPEQPEVVAAVTEAVDGRGALVLVGLGALQRLVAAFEAYAPLVPVGSYVVMENTVLNGRPVAPGFGPGAHEAVTDVLARHRDFVPDVAFERYTLTFNKNGYLRRMRPA